MNIFKYKGNVYSKTVLRVIFVNNKYLSPDKENNDGFVIHVLYSNILRGGSTIPRRRVSTLGGGRGQHTILPKTA